MRRSKDSAELGISAAEVLVGAALAFLLLVLVWPKTVRSIRTANEASAIATMKEIGQAEITYASTYPAIGFAENLGQLGGLNEPCSPTTGRACLLAEVARPPFAYRGYSFSAFGRGVPRTSFLAGAVPLQIGDTGQLSFCITNRWRVHYRADGLSVADGETCDEMPAVRRE